MTVFIISFIVVLVFWLECDDGLCRCRFFLLEADGVCPQHLGLCLSAIGYLQGRFSQIDVGEGLTVGRYDVRSVARFLVRRR
jgi:hypothetical protein